MTGNLVQEQRGNPANLWQPGIDEYLTRTDAAGTQAS
jgi:hypothetical protein